MLMNMFTAIFLTITVMFIAGIISGLIIHRDANMDEE